LVRIQRYRSPKNFWWCWNLFRVGYRSCVCIY
jgi:hypothetical protein